MTDILITLDVDDGAEARLYVDETEDVDLSIGAEYISGRAQEYEGPYEVTPSNATQVLQVADKQATQDIVVNPIPSYYGLITWDGSKLKVS